MMRVFLFSLFSVFSISLFSQSTDVKRDIGFFNAIETKGSVDVVYVPSEEHAVLIKSSSPEDIITEIRDKKLYIFTQNGKSLLWNEMRSVGKKYTVYVYAPSLDEIESVGSGNVVIEGILKSENLSIATSGSGNFTGQLNVETLRLKSSGSGNFRLKGNVVKADISSSGSGNIQSFDLFVENCSISKSGSGNTQVTVEKNLLASISGSGNLSYKGDPSNVSSTSSGTGKIKKV